MTILANMNAGQRAEFQTAMLASTAVVFPTEFGWDFGRFPVQVYRRADGRYYSDVNPRSLGGGTIDAAPGATVGTF